ncbi:MAG: MerR family transcriptional regulator [Thermodesulfobacteriota bacterium]|jgi:DNA-binding transcriptional MerR regulator
MADGVLIGEICRRTGCTPRTIRHYEAEGLLAPVATTPGGRKIYGEEAVSIFHTAQVLKRIGYSIKDIRGILSLTKSENTKGKKLTRKLRKMLSSSISQIQSEIELLTATHGKISDLLEKTKNCEGCGAPDCAPCGKLRDLRTLGLLS